MICLRSRDHLAGTSGFRVIWIEGRRGVLHDERHRRVVGADDRARPHHLPEVRDQGANEMGGRF